MLLSAAYVVVDANAYIYICIYISRRSGCPLVGTRGFRDYFFQCVSSLDATRKFCRGIIVAETNDMFRYVPTQLMSQKKLNTLRGDLSPSFRPGFFSVQHVFQAARKCPDNETFCDRVSAETDGLAKKSRTTNVPRRNGQRAIFHCFIRS